MAVPAPVEAGRSRRTPAIAATTNTASTGNGTSSERLDRDRDDEEAGRRAHDGDQRAPAAPGEVPDGEAADRPEAEERAGRGRAREGGPGSSARKNSTGPGGERQGHDPAADRGPPAAHGEARPADDQRRERELEEQQRHAVILATGDRIARRPAPYTRAQWTPPPASAPPAILSCRRGSGHDRRMTAAPVARPPATGGIRVVRAVLRSPVAAARHARVPPVQRRGVRDLGRDPALRLRRHRSGVGGRRGAHPAPARRRSSPRPPPRWPTATAATASCSPAMPCRRSALR